MITRTFPRLVALAAFSLTAAAACGRGVDSVGETEGASSPDEALLIRYSREFIFVASRSDEPLVVPFSFRTGEEGVELERVAQAWLARGGTWDRFLDDTARTSRAGGVWRVVPQGDLRVGAGGSTELEGFRFSRGERRLRLDLLSPLTEWNQGGDTRFRLLSGQLAIGAETFPGPVLEVLRVERALDDGWPVTQEMDSVFLTSGDSIQILVAQTNSGAEVLGYGWTRVFGGERTWQEADIRRIELRPFQDARREIPQRWSFRIPNAGIEGELQAAGFDAVLGPERGGRRAIEVRFTVEGWADLQGERRPVTGMIRHTQL